MCCVSVFRNELYETSERQRAKQADLKHLEFEQGYDQQLRRLARRILNSHRLDHLLYEGGVETMPRFVFHYHNSPVQIP